MFKFISAEEPKQLPIRKFSCPVCLKYFSDTEMHQHIQNSHGNPRESDPLALDDDDDDDIAENGDDGDDDEVEVIDDEMDITEDPLFVAIWSSNTVEMTVNV